MTDKERKIVQLALLYELRLMIRNSGKDAYTTNELCDLLDTIAEAKAQDPE